MKEIEDIEKIIICASKKLDAHEHYELADDLRQAEACISETLAIALDMTEDFAKALSNVLEGKKGAKEKARQLLIRYNEN